MNRGIASYAMVFVILCLYGLDTLTIAFSWSLGSYVFIGNGWNFWTVFLALVISTPPSMKAQWAVSIAGGISTLLADTSLVRQFPTRTCQDLTASQIWRCWTVWGRRWLIVLIPIVCTLTGTGIVHSEFAPPNPALTEDSVIKIVDTYHLIHDTPDNTQDLLSYGSAAIWSILYISFLMATTIICTLLIIYRIVTVTGGMGIRSYRGVIEIIVESALIYSLSLLAYVVLVARESSGGPYADVIASAARVGPLFSVFSVPALIHDGRESHRHLLSDESLQGMHGPTNLGTEVSHRRRLFVSDVIPKIRVKVP